MESSSLSNLTKVTEAVGGIRERTQEEEYQVSPKSGFSGSPSQKEGFEW
jgi:hypothetical protein